MLNKKECIYYENKEKMLKENNVYNKYNELGLSTSLKACGENIVSHEACRELQIIITV